MLAAQGSEEDIGNPRYDEQRKYDGTRTFIIKDGDNVVMRGRSWINDYAPNFPEIVEEVRKLPVEACVLDSEITFFEKGSDRDVFISALAGPETKKGRTAKAMVFDVLFIEDYDLENLPFKERQEILGDLVPDRLRHVDVVETVTRGKKAYFRKIGKKGGEGVVLKERQSPYSEGERTSDWLKVKHWRSDDAVVVGYTKGKDSRASTFGALILAQRDKKGKWRYIGKTSGFTNQELQDYLKRLRRTRIRNSPLATEDVHEVDNVKAWVKPKIVIEVKYYEKTPSGRLRFPSYMRERHDKQPRDCSI